MHIGYLGGNSAEIKRLLPIIQAAYDNRGCNSLAAVNLGSYHDCCYEIVACRRGKKGGRTVHNPVGWLENISRSAAKTIRLTAAQWDENRAI